MVRHVDALDPLPDEKIKELDAAYLVRRHSTPLQVPLDRNLHNRKRVPETNDGGIIY